MGGLECEICVPVLTNQVQACSTPQTALTSMVAGAYTKGNGSQSKPVYLKYAPSHAERPRTRDYREKGKGWQRSKSSMYDNSSDLYFCEKRMSYDRYRRAQSSMSDRRTGKNSSSYEIDCPAKRPRRRRASVEAIVQSAKPESTAIGQSTAPIGLPIQKRVQTYKEGGVDRDCVAPNKPIYGWTHTSNYKSSEKGQIIEREGPKARAYTPRYETSGGDVRAFPYAESELNVKTHECKQRCMEMLVSTESFRGRPGAAESDETADFTTDEAEPYPVYSTFRPEVNSDMEKYLNEMRIELKSAEVPENRVMEGRVFFDLKEPATVESIGIDINKTLAMTRPDGKVVIPSRDNRSFAPELKLLPNRQLPLVLPDTGSQPTDPSAARRLPNDFALIETIAKKAPLQAGRSAIPFKIYVPENQVPTFTYTSLKGPSVISNYSAEAVVRMGGRTERTGRVPIKVPALGEKNVGYRDENKNYEILVNNKYFTKEEGFDYALGYTESDTGYDKPSKVYAKVLRVVKCPAINLNERTYVADLGSASVSSGKSNPVVDKYRQNPANPSVKNDWDANAYDENNVVTSTTPTVSTGAFTCDYFLELTVDDEVYKGPVILVDQYADNASKRTDIRRGHSLLGIDSVMNNLFKSIQLTCASNFFRSYALVYFPLLLRHYLL
ncbi:expressed conserved protein [Echinococcus multilocularis]|uniref:Expressed conserved protein n=1 Tax=Echinococcus multilocularis TaxID=6211 RepID=A0A068YKY0_ECHMU|nr:expressed conserved protein [Echinococcus multilocularis]